MDQVVTGDKEKAKYKKYQIKKRRYPKTSITILFLILIVWGYVFRSASQIAEEYEEVEVITTVDQPEEEVVNLDSNYFPDGYSLTLFQDTSPLNINIFEQQMGTFPTISSNN